MRNSFHPSRRDVLLTTVAAALPFSSKALSAPGAGPATQKAKPNIILILLDDMGFADIGCYGSEIRTPRIDSLATTGMRYNRFDTCAICSPTRAALLTGRNPQTVHMEDLPGSGNAPPFDQAKASSGEMPLNAQTVAQALQVAGYGTYALGKWHLCPMYKDAPERNRASWPLQRGFDYFYGFLDGHTSQYNPDLVENNSELPKTRPEGYHLSVDLVDRAIGALKQDNGGKPKFLYLALGAAHTPYHVPKPYIDAYKGVYDKGWDAIRAERFERQKRLKIVPEATVLPPREAGDAAWESLDDQHKRVFAKFMETYAGFVTHADEQIGRLIDHLKQTGEFDNTLIFLMTDNGAASEGGRDGGFRKPYRDGTKVSEMDAALGEAGGPTTYMMYQRPWAYAGNTPLRRYKVWPHLGGVRTPMVVSWPAAIKEAGAIRTQLVNAIDIAPTILDVAGGAFASDIAGVQQIPVAGQSILPTFMAASAPGRQVQFFELRGDRAVTQGRWRAVAMHRLGTDYEQDLWQLFDVESDFSESNDLSSTHPEKLREMKELWWQEARRYSDPPLTPPVEFFYKVYGMGDAFAPIGD